MNKSHPDDHIFQLMIDKLHGSITPSDREYLDGLIAQDPQVQKVWDNIRQGFAAEDLATNFERFKEPAYWPDLQPGAAPVMEEEDTPKKRALPGRIARVAAVLLGIVIAGYYLLPGWRKQTDRPLQVATGPAHKKAVQLQLASGSIINLSKTTDTNVADTRLKNTNKTLTYTAGSTIPPGENVLTVPVGLDYRISLSDGTEVWLNSATTLRFPFSFNDNTREITINGEAYLKIAADAARPFIVHTPHSSVNVLGTEFNINTYDSGLVKVALVEGAVQFKAAGNAVKVKPGEQAVYARQKGITLEPFDRMDVLSWREGQYFFRNRPLNEICKVFPRWYGTTVVMDNPSIAAKRFSGLLSRNETPETFLENLKATTELDYYTDKNGVLHLK